MKAGGKSTGESAWKVDVLLRGNWRGATSVLLSNGPHHIVVDTGMPHEAHQLVRALAERGLKPAEVGAVVNTHFHIDHVLNNSLFPSSVFYASQESHDWCRALYSDLFDGLHWEKLVLKYYPETFEYEKSKENMGKLRKLALRWWDVERLGSPSQYRWIESHGLPEGLTSLLTWGHVPGHVSVIVNSGDRRTLIAGDALLAREENAEVLTMIPHNREQSHRDRDRILSIVGRILPGHDREFLAGEQPTNDKTPGASAGTGFDPAGSSGKK